MEQHVIVVSSDSHAGMPKELWSEYLDPAFHDLLPQHNEAHNTGWHGLHDPVLRMADMDVEALVEEDLADLVAT
jgi:hypothetical protein